MKRPAIAALCAAGCALLAPGQALAVKETVITCGMLVTESIRVANDLNCAGPAFNGLEVADDGITIDLNGHTITGTKVAGAVGIDNSNGAADPNTYAKVTIKNGTIRGFDRGIYLSNDADRNQLKRLTLIDNGFNNAIKALGVDRLSITNSEFFLNDQHAIALEDVTNARVERNTIRDNGTPLSQTAGILLTGASSRNTLSKNDIEGQLGGPSLTGLPSGDGIFVNTTVTATRLTGNEATGNTGDGIEVLSTDAGTVLRGNEAFFNLGRGIFAADGVTDGGRNDAGGNAGINCSPNIDCTD